MRQDDLRAQFLCKVPVSLQAEAAALGSLLARLEEIEGRGQGAWPALRLAPGVVTTALASRLRQSAPRKGLEDWLDHVQAEDFHLAVCCAEGVVGAIEAFERAYKADLEGLLRRFRGPDMGDEELLQSLREKLFVGSSGRSPKIGDYAGQGYLQNWLRVTGARTFIDILRSTSRRGQVEAAYSPERLLEMPDLGEDVELDFLKREYRAQFKEAFAQAAAALESQERNLLRQHLVGGLSVHQLGKLYNVHPSTAARWVAKAREQLLLATRRALVARLRIESGEFASIMEMIRSRLDLSMSRLLQSERVEGE